MKYLIPLVLILLISCGRTPSQYYHKLKSKEIRGLIIATKIKKGGYSLLIVNKTDTINLWKTHINYAQNYIFKGDSIFKLKGEMIYRIKRNDSTFFLDGSISTFDKQDKPRNNLEYLLDLIKRK